MNMDLQGMMGDGDGEVDEGERAVLRRPWGYVTL